MMNKRCVWGFALFFILSVGVTGCSDSRPAKKASNPNFAIDSALEKIDLEIALLDYTTRVHSETACMLAESLAGIKDKDPFMQRMVSQSVTGCEMARYYVTATRPTIAAIRQRGRLIEPLYEFTVFESGEPPTEKTIGPFMDLASCQETEALAHQKGEATRACQRWQASFPPASPAR